MKQIFRIFFYLTLFLWGTQHLSAQVITTSDLFKYNNIRVRMTLQDKTTEEPIPWASVYLIPDGDTTITHFALSDEQGKVLLKEVPVGRYQVNVEIIGYKPYQKVHKFEAWEEDMGSLLLEQDLQQLEAALVSAIGNPITITKDTIEFNAAAYRVGENAMLEDLLKKMPGMEVSEDGTVTLNGESIDKITVGGRTFFFNDPSAALKNLPAKLVDKIKVIDKESRDAEFSGISSGNDKEKVMDVQLKEEYQHGWFGNARIGLGHDLMKENENNLIMDPGLLYNTNAIVTGYTEKDQVVVIGNAYNVTDPTGFVFYSSMSDIYDDEYSTMRGIGTNASGALNYNTERIKNFETSVSANYKYGTKDERSRRARTSYFSESDPLFADTYKEGFGEEHSMNATIEIESKEGENRKWDLYFTNVFHYWDNQVESENLSSSRQDTIQLNESSTTTLSQNKKFMNNLYAGGGLKFKNERRVLTFGISHTMANAHNDKQEISQLKELGNLQVQDLFYKTDKNSHAVYAQIAYVEPLSKRWSLKVSNHNQFNIRTTDTRATNPDGSTNEYYSAHTHNRYISEEGRLLLQYRTDTTRLHIGVSFDMVLNELNSRSLGIENRSGYNDWLFNWSPFLNYHYNTENHNLFVAYNGSSQQVSNEQSVPTLNLSNRVQIQVGNIYLKPSYNHWMNASYRYNNRKNFSFLNLNAYMNTDTRPIVYASWFDENGIRYAIPVNSSAPALSLNFHANYNRPLDKAKKLTFGTNGSISYNNNLSYQATSFLPGLNVETFDYHSFMDQFWGTDATGDLFYNGQSGFEESRMHTLSWNASINFKYNLERLTLQAEAGTRNSRSRYSLDPSANMNTWNHRFSGNLLFQPGKGWEIQTEASYQLFRGYSNGYGDPELKWDVSIGKNIGKWTLSAQVVDILNQTRSLRRTTSAEYVEDTYSNVMGRYFLFSISFNFGKMNAAKNNAIQNAMWRSVL